jgi:hypothetical protein
VLKEYLMVFHLVVSSAIELVTPLAVALVCNLVQG